MQFYGKIARSIMQFWVFLHTLSCKIVKLLKNSASFIEIRTDSGDVANLQTHNPP